MESDIVKVDKLDVDFGGSEERGGMSINGDVEREMLKTHLTNRSVRTFFTMTDWFCADLGDVNQSQA